MHYVNVTSISGQILPYLCFSYTTILFLSVYANVIAHHVHIYIRVHPRGSIQIFRNITLSFGADLCRFIYQVRLCVCTHPHSLCRPFQEQSRPSSHTGRCSVGWYRSAHSLRYQQRTRLCLGVRT